MTRTWNLLDSDEKAVLCVEEEELEIRSIDMGLERYRKERYASDRSYGWPEQKMMVDALDTLIPAIHKLQVHAAAGKPIKGVRYWGTPMLSLPADKLAFITLSAMVNLANFGEASRMANVSRGIGTQVKIEREFALIKRDAPDVYRFMKKHAKNWTKRTHRTAKAKAANIDTGWTPRITHWLGMVLLEQVITHTTMFELQRFIIHGKTDVRLSLTRDTYDMIETMHSECELLRPFYLPMVVPPKTWGEEEGGYLFQPVRLVKPNLAGDWKAHRSDVEMPLVVKAVNHLQATEWRINRRVLPVLTQLWDVGGGWASLPTSDPLPIPPPEFEWGTASDEDKKVWKLQATRIHDENARLGSKRKSIIHKLWIAHKLHARKAVYFPWQLCWRGRAYPIPSHLHPQSDDVGRSLLEFANCHELGERGVHWLHVHLANCYGHDKDSYSERVNWVRSNLAHIKQSANDPFAHRWWAGAEKPWQTLAACFEVAEASPEYASHLPVQVDATCSGLQHFSALGRDVGMARTVNLLPNDRPQDVYQDIADLVSEVIEVECEERRRTKKTLPEVYPNAKGKGNPPIQLCESKRQEEGDQVQSDEGVDQRTDRERMSDDGDSIRHGERSREETVQSIIGQIRTKWPLHGRQRAGRDMDVQSDEESMDPRRSDEVCPCFTLNGHVTRKTVKRAVMTMCYGLTYAGMMKQYLSDNACEGLSGSVIDNAAYLRDVTWEALDGALTGAASIMEWLRQVAVLASKENKAVTWVTQLGFPVVQEYLTQRETHLYTAMQKLTIRTPGSTRTISSARQIRGLPPNFVHSQDASHMMATVLNCAERGISDFSMIHDSFGVHAAMVDDLQAALREEFVRQYSGNLLADMHQHWEQELDISLPPPPPQGELELEEIIKSEYLFG